MNNAQNNWFYKMCVKQCVKDVALVAGGVICFVIAIMLFGAHVIGIINFAFMGLGILKFLFVPQETNDSMIVDGTYARH